MTATDQKQCDAWAEVTASNNAPLTIRCDKTLAQHQGEEVPKHRCTLSVAGGQSWAVHWTGSIPSPLVSRWRSFTAPELLTLSNLLGDTAAGDVVIDQLWREIDAQLRAQKVI